MATMEQREEQLDELSERYCHLEERLELEREELNSLKKENKRLQAFHAVAPQPGWFVDAVANRILPDSAWLRDYAEKYAAALLKGEK